MNAGVVRHLLPQREALTDPVVTGAPWLHTAPRFALGGPPAPDRQGVAVRLGRLNALCRLLAGSAIHPSVDRGAGRYPLIVGFLGGYWPGCAERRPRG